MYNSFKNDPVLKAIGAIVAITLVIGLIFFLFGRPAGLGVYGYGRMGGDNYGMMGGNGDNYGMMGGYVGMQSGFSFGGILSTLFHILMAVSVLGLVVGLAVYLYQLIVKRINNSAPIVTSGTVTNATCAHCNAKIPGDAQFCPACGTKVNKAE